MVVVSLQLAFLGLIALDNLGLGIPILRQVIGFLYLTFVPGILLLGVFKINNLNTVETLLYSVGLSLSFLMITGFLMNFFYPLIGISEPISEIPLVITISAIVLFLCFIYYLRNKNSSFSININQVFFPSFLSLSLLPFLAIFGTYLLNFYDNNALLLILLPVISIIPILVVYNKVSSDKYSFAIWIISISLLLHNSLIGQYVSWGDSEVEYLISNLVLTNGFWDMAIPATTNSLLSITMLHPIYSIICNIELTWVFKITYPLLFSLAPVALYVAFKRQTNDKIAFLSSSLFMFSFNFFTLLSRNTRTGLAILFLAFLALLMTDKDISGMKKRILGVAIILSIAVIYYGVSYMLLLFLFPVVLLHFLDKKPDKNRLITPTFASLFVVFAVAWYMYTSNSYGFNTLVGFGKNFVNQFMEFLTAPRSSPTYYLKKKWSISLEVVKYLNVILILFIAIGILDLIYKIIKGKEISFSKDYSFLSIIFFFFLFATLAPLPGNVQRILQISLVFLAPFSVIGCIRLFNTVSRIFKYPLNEKNILKVFFLYLLILLLFDSGFVSAILTKDLNPNILINKKHIMEEGDLEEKEYFYRIYMPKEDFSSASWLKTYKSESVRRLYYSPPADSYHSGTSLLHYAEIVPINYWGKIRAIRIENDTIIRETAYIYLSYENIVERIMIGKDYELLDVNRIYSAMENESKIYVNGGSEIYYH